MGKKILIRSLCLAAAGVICFFTLGSIFSNSETYSRQIETIDKKKTVALEMTTAVTATSVAITMLPDDIGTPVAERAADLTGYLMVIVIALFAEKYLLTLSGMLAFRFVIPAALILFAAAPLWKNDTVKPALIKITAKIILFSLILWALVPACVSVMNTIDREAELSAQNAIEQAEKYSDSISEHSENESGLTAWLEKFKNGAAGIAAKADAVLNNFVEAIGVMIVTTCILPLAAFAVLLWILKLLTGIDIKVKMPKGSRTYSKLRACRKKITEKGS